jgi:hypothetical protein
MLRRLLTAYGRDFDPAVLTAYTPLHVYSNRPWSIGELCVRDTSTPRSLAEAWFDTALRRGGTAAACALPVRSPAGADGSLLAC